MKMEWRKNIVEWTDQDGERANLSVAFTWDALKAYSRSVWLRQAGYSVRVGGLGVFTMRKMFTGVAEVGGDVPDAVRWHNGAATFASKGCPVWCNFCLVPAMVPFACGVRRLKVPMTIGGDTPKANGTWRCLRRRDNRIRADTRQYRRHRGGFPKWREWKSLQAGGSEALEGLAEVG